MNQKIDESRRKFLYKSGELNIADFAWVYKTKGQNLMIRSMRR
jgi:hypothetical protein